MARRPWSRISFPSIENSIVRCKKAAIRQHRLPASTYHGSMNPPLTMQRAQGAATTMPPTLPQPLRLIHRADDPRRRPRAIGIIIDDRIDIEPVPGLRKLPRQIADELSRRLIKIFMPDPAGQRAVFGNQAIFQTDPHWRDYLLFYEYFHADTGAGLGASHQTGWTGLVAKLIQQQGEHPGGAGVKG